MKKFTEFMASKTTGNPEHLISSSEKHKLFSHSIGGSTKLMNFYVTDQDNAVIGQGSKRTVAYKSAKLKAPDIDALDDTKNHSVKIDKYPKLGQISVSYHDDPKNLSVSVGSAYRNLGYHGRRRWFEDHDEALKFAKDLNGKTTHKVHEDK